MSYCSIAGKFRNEARKKMIDLGNKLTCVICGASKGRVIVHHKDENWANNEINNLEVLCSCCHERAHVRGHKNRYRNKSIYPVATKQYKQRYGYC